MTSRSALKTATRSETIQRATRRVGVAASQRRGRERAAWKATLIGSDRG